MHVNYKCSVLESSYTVVAVNKPSYIHKVLSYYSLWRPLHIFNFLWIFTLSMYMIIALCIYACMYVHLFTVGAVIFRMLILKIGHIQTEVATWCLLLNIVPDNSGVVIAVVVVLLILVGCITMDILFRYCCKRTMHSR